MGWRGSSKCPDRAIHDEHVNRYFNAQSPNQVWVTDITEHFTA